MKTVPVFFNSVFLELWFYSFLKNLVVPFLFKHSLKVCTFIRLPFPTKTFACSDDNQRGYLNIWYKTCLRALVHQCLLLCATFVHAVG